MAAAYRALNSAFNNNGTGLSGTTRTITVTKPTGTVDNDILIGHWMINYGGATLTGRTLPSGFTLLWDTWQSTSGDHYVVGWKRAASEGASYAFQYTADVEYVYNEGQIIAYSGCNTGSVIDDSGAGSEAVGTTSHVAPSKTATYTNDLMVVLGVEDTYAAASCSGFTERFDDSANYSFKLYDKTLSASGATGTATIVMGSGDGIAGTILLIDASPAGGGGGPTVKPLAALGVG